MEFIQSLNQYGSLISIAGSVIVACLVWFGNNQTRQAKNLNSEKDRANSMDVATLQHEWEDARGNIKNLVENIAFYSAVQDKYIEEVNNLRPKEAPLGVIMGEFRGKVTHPKSGILTTADAERILGLMKIL